MIELSEQHQRCHDCYLTNHNREFSADCRIFLSYKGLGVDICPTYDSILSDIRKAQTGDPNLGAGAMIVWKLAEEGHIQVPDMNIFTRYFDETKRD
jgi:hypothetical protein